MKEFAFYFEIRGVVSSIFSNSTHTDFFFHFQTLTQTTLIRLYTALESQKSLYNFFLIMQ